MKDILLYKIINNKKNISKLSKEIVAAFKEQANSENIEYNFVIDSRGSVNNDAINTSFSFDTKKETLLYDIKKAMFSEDLEHIEEGSEEEKELMEKSRSFFVEVCADINKRYKNDIEEVIRKIVLGNKYNKDIVPLDEIRVIMIDIADYEAVPECAKYLLKIEKESRTNGYSYEIDSEEIAVFVNNQQEETGMTPHEIFLIEKKIGNPMFRDIKNIQTASKYLNEIVVHMFVDYSVKTK